MDPTPPRGFAVDWSCCSRAEDRRRVKWVVIKEGKPAVAMASGAPSPIPQHTNYPVTRVWLLASWSLACRVVLYLFLNLFLRALITCNL
jgi:hypothetical protein